MIKDFGVTSDAKKVSWYFEGQKVEMAFQYPISANNVSHLQEIIIQSDTRESGETNLAIYNADGSLKCRPKMPKFEHEVQGVYSIWFIPDKDQITVILLSDEYKPYDTACTFNLKTCKFSKFHPTK